MNDSYVYTVLSLIFCGCETLSICRRGVDISGVRTQKKGRIFGTKKTRTWNDSVM
jgi:hypothetical protein